MKHRIVRDVYRGFEVQTRWLNFLWWVQGRRGHFKINTHNSIEKAKAWAKAGNVVEYFDL